MKQSYMLLRDYLAIRKYATANVHDSRDISLNLQINDLVITTRKREDDSNGHTQNKVYIKVDQSWVKEMRERMKKYQCWQILQKGHSVKLKTTRTIKNRVVKLNEEKENA